MLEMDFATQLKHEFNAEDHSELLENILKEKALKKGNSRKEIAEEVKRVISMIGHDNIPDDKRKQYDLYLLGEYLKDMIYKRYNPPIPWEEWSAKFDRYIERKTHGAAGKVS